MQHTQYSIYCTLAEPKYDHLSFTSHEQEVGHRRSQSEPDVELLEVVTDQVTHSSSKPC